MTLTGVDNASFSPSDTFFGMTFTRNFDVARREQDSTMPQKRREFFEHGNGSFRMELDLGQRGSMSSLAITHTMVPAGF